MAIAGRAVILAFAGFIPLTAHAQGSELRGRVLGENGAPIVGATVTLAGIGYTVRTDTAGAFVLSGTPGSILSFTIRAPGFRADSASATLPRRSTVSRDFMLAAESSVPTEANPSDRVLRGYVMDIDGGGLSYASIQVNGGRRFVADDSGRFTMPPLTGRFWLLVRRIGFAPAELTLDAAPDTAIRIRMTPVATALPEQRITGRAAFVSLGLNGFYQRMKDSERGINHGYFVTPEDLEFRKPNQITQMAEGFPAVYLKRNAMYPRLDMIVGAPCRPRGSVDKGCVEAERGLFRCVMTVYLDRVRITGRLGNTQDDFINELVMPSQIAAMEIYPRGVGAPPQYQSMNGSCGVVLIWSK